MPSQNLPKPNIPDKNGSNIRPNQNQPSLNSNQPSSNPSQPVQLGKLSPNQTSSSSNSTPTKPLKPILNMNSIPKQASPIFNSKKAAVPQPIVPQLNKSQAIPEGLSRENPGGTPPGMKVSATGIKTTDPVGQNDLAQSADLYQKTNLKAPSLSSAPIPAPKVKELSFTDQSISKKEAPILGAQSASAAPVLTPTPTSAPVQNSAPIAANAAAKTPTPASVSTTKINKTKKKSSSAKKKISLPVMIMGGITILLILILIISQVFGNKKSKTEDSGSTDSSAIKTSKPVSITYWGLWEDSQIIKEVISDFEEKNPNITVDYRKQSHIDYRERLQQAISSGNGPDVFRFHASWTGMLSDSLAAMPTNIMTATEYQTSFYPVAYKQLQLDGQIFGIPLMYDGLALFYNKEIFKTANLSVPRTWSELRNTANKLTVPSNPSDRKANNITRGGLAIGNAGNVDHFSDILALLILQNGGSPADPSSKYVKDALTFYTNFIKQDQVWSDRLPNSTIAFARSEVAMIFAPSWRIHDINNLNPDLDFGVAQLPQLDSNNPIAFASYWAEGVSNSSKNKSIAWVFLDYLASPEVLKKFYADASKVRSFGEIYPRKEMAEELNSNDLITAFLKDALIADSWYMSSFTHDNGINDQIIKYYEDAVNEVLSGVQAEQALTTTAKGVNEVLAKYAL